MDEQKTLNKLKNDLVVPGPVRIVPVKNKGIGGVPGLPFEELADLEELERQVVREMSGPDLPAPKRKRHRGGDAYRTADCKRRDRPHGRRRFEINRLLDELNQVGITSDIVARRLPPVHKQVLAYLRSGVIQLAHVTNDDMIDLAKLDQRRQMLRQRLGALRSLEVSQ